MIVVCPCCNRPMEAARVPIESLTSAPLPGRERRVVEALAAVYPRALDMHALVDAVYGDDPNGGPELAGKAVASIIDHMRRRIQKYGWTIPKTTTKGIGHKGRYRLTPSEDVGS